jgi:membrane associated rhomboid family serine protease
MLPLRDARPTRRTPVVTLAIMLVCTVVFSYELVVLVQGGEAALNAFLEDYGLVAANLVEAWSNGNVVSTATLGLATHMILHGSWFHLFGNLLFLWIFGPNVEDRLGRVTFLVLFIAGGLAAALLQVAVDPTLTEPMVGASGAISAVLGAYLVLFPGARIQSRVFLILFYELIAIPSVLVLGFWFLLQIIDGVASLGLTDEAAGGIAFWAHIGGFVAGMLLALPLRFVRPDRGPVPAGAATPGPDAVAVRIVPLAPYDILPSAAGPAPDPPAPDRPLSAPPPPPPAAPPGPPPPPARR